MFLSALCSLLRLVHYSRRREKTRLLAAALWTKTKYVGVVCQSKVRQKTTKKKSGEILSFVSLNLGFLPRFS